MFLSVVSHDFGADKLYEYQWPQEGKGEWYMLQEQVSDFLGVKSFKRKYPGTYSVCKALTHECAPAILRLIAPIAYENNVV